MSQHFSMMIIAPLSIDNIIDLDLSFAFRRSCKLHFDAAPMKVVRASKQYMYDDIGNEFLDCISNVSHGKLLKDFLLSYWPLNGVIW